MREGGIKWGGRVQVCAVYASAEKVECKGCYSTMQTYGGNDEEFIQKNIESR